MPYKDPEVRRVKAAERQRVYRERHPERIRESQRKFLTPEQKERLAREQQERLLDSLFRADKLQKERVYQKTNRKQIQVKNTLLKTKTRHMLALLKAERGCYDCGGRFPSEALDWDHLPGSEKLFSIGSQAQNHTFDAVIDEIAKCQVVCANCHRIRTTNRRKEKI